MQYGELARLLADLQEPGGIGFVVDHTPDGGLAEHQFLTEHALDAVLDFILPALLKFKRGERVGKRLVAQADHVHQAIFSEFLFQLRRNSDE